MLLAVAEEAATKLEAAWPGSASPGAINSSLGPESSSTGKLGSAFKSLITNHQHQPKQKGSDCSWGPGFGWFLHA